MQIINFMENIQCNFWRNMSILKVILLGLNVNKVYNKIIRIWNEIIRPLDRYDYGD